MTYPSLVFVDYIRAASFMHEIFGAVRDRYRTGSDKLNSQCIAQYAIADNELLWRNWQLRNRRDFFAFSERKKCYLAL